MDGDKDDKGIDKDREKSTDIVVRVSLEDSLAPFRAELRGLRDRLAALERFYASPREVFRLKDTARELGCTVTQVSNWIKEGQIPAKKAGKVVFIFRQSLLDWLNSLPDAPTGGG